MRGPIFLAHFVAGQACQTAQLPLMYACSHSFVNLPLSDPIQIVQKLLVFISDRNYIKEFRIFAK